MYQFPQSTRRSCARTSSQIRLRVVPHFSSGIVERAKRETRARVKITPREKRRHAAGREIGLRIPTGRRQTTWLFTSMAAQVAQARNMSIGEHRRAWALLRNIRNIRICMGKKPIVSVTYENERISIKNSLPYLKCVESLLCDPRADLWPFYGFLCREKTVNIKTHKTGINRPVDHTGET